MNTATTPGRIPDYSKIPGLLRKAQLSDNTPTRAGYRSFVDGIGFLPWVAPGGEQRVAWFEGWTAAYWDTRMAIVAAACVDPKYIRRLDWWYKATAAHVFNSLPPPHSK
jgi:hypothetical protein